MMLIGPATEHNSHAFLYQTSTFASLTGCLDCGLYSYQIKDQCETNQALNGLLAHYLVFAC